MKTNQHEDDIVEQLKEMPTIKDHNSKEETFQRISSEINQTNIQTSKTSKLIPVFIGILAVMVMFIAIPSIIHKNVSLTDEDNAKGAEYSVESDHDSKIFKADLATDETNEFPSFLVHDIDDQNTIIYGAVTDDQLQTVIPISIIVPASDDLSMQYNELENYLAMSTWQGTEYFFKGTTFDINLSANEVTMSLPEDFSVGEGSAGAHMFGEVLDAMFKPYQIKRIVFDQRVDLGQIGEVTEYPLPQNEKENYKLYQVPDQEKKYLIPDKQIDNLTIEEAIENMKLSEPAFNVYATIPADVKFILDTSSDQELIITLKNTADFDEETWITMIDAILMTAKSFDYESVMFESLPFDEIGSYQLSDAISVPKGINPIYMLDE